jgi:hypothetical protein
MNETILMSSSYPPRLSSRLLSSLYHHHTTTSGSGGGIIGSDDDTIARRMVERRVLLLEIRADSDNQMLQSGSFSLQGFMHPSMTSEDLVRLKRNYMQYLSELSQLEELGSRSDTARTVFDILTSECCRGANKKQCMQQLSGYFGSISEQQLDSLLSLAAALQPHSNDGGITYRPRGGRGGDYKWSTAVFNPPRAVFPPACSLYQSPYQHHLSVGPTASITIAPMTTTSADTTWLQSLCTRYLHSSSAHSSSSVFESPSQLFDNILKAAESCSSHPPPLSESCSSHPPPLSGGIDENQLQVALFDLIGMSSTVVV